MADSINHVSYCMTVQDIPQKCILHSRQVRNQEMQYYVDKKNLQKNMNTWADINVSTDICLCRFIYNTFKDTGCQ